MLERLVTHMRVEFVEVFFEDDDDYSHPNASDCVFVDPNDPRLTQEILQLDPEADAYAPNVVILRVVTDALGAASIRVQ
jgi:hypothetical protein